MDTLEFEAPFRWNIQERTTLGSLLDGPRKDFPSGPPPYVPVIEPVYYPTDALAEMSGECARIIALSNEADLCFVGRSLESLFDYLSGLLSDTDWAERLWLLQFSWYGRQIIQPHELAGLRYYFESIELDPYHLARRKRPVAFVDIVASGGTFGNLVTFLCLWAKEIGEDWAAVKRKIRIIGLTRRAKTSPNTWRWQQHITWRDLLPRQAVKSVAMAEGLWDYFGAWQEKTTDSYTHSRWGSSIAAQPNHTEEHLRALRLAVQCFDWGREKARRQTFARQLSDEKTMIHPWFRDLVRAVKQ
ncbi:MAG TPA: hypothetical protein VGF38_12645 [Ktedonobacterales bacterium]|jgi:hypothetical protein